MFVWDVLLHDVGKIVTDEEGNHMELGVNLLKKYGIPKEVIACVAEHHEDRPFSSNESVIVWMADAISGSRPVPDMNLMKIMLKE